MANEKLLGALGDRYEPILEGLRELAGAPSGDRASTSAPYVPTAEQAQVPLCLQLAAKGVTEAEAIDHLARALSAAEERAKRIAELSASGLHVTNDGGVATTPDASRERTFTPTPEEVASCAVLAEVAGKPEREAVMVLADRVKDLRADLLLTTDVLGITRDDRDRWRQLAFERRPVYDRALHVAVRLIEAPLPALDEVAPGSRLTRAVRAAALAVRTEAVRRAVTSRI